MNKPPYKIKVLFANTCLGGGGAQRVMIQVLRGLDRTRFVPILVLLERKGIFLSEVPGDVKIVDLGRYGSGGRLRWLLNYVYAIRREMPDVIFSFLAFVNLASIIARFLSRSTCRLIVSERTTVKGTYEGFIDNVLRHLTIRLYCLADRVIPNSEEMRQQFIEKVKGVNPRHIVAIPNPVDVDRIRDNSKEITATLGMGPLPIVVGMGRLSVEKGFDVLVRSMKYSLRKFHLIHIGEGPEEGSLRDLVNGLELNNRVTFVGFQPNPFPLLRQAAVFVLPSRFEGFPNALVEAMALGVPCVSTRCSTGPSEIITNRVNGMLIPVEDPVCMAKAIDELLSDKSLRERIGKAGMERVQDFDIAEIIPRFERLIEDVVA